MRKNIRYTKEKDANLRESIANGAKMRQAEIRKLCLLS